MVEPLEKSGFFPPDMIQMVAAGEETGRLGDMLDRVADYYDTLVGHGVKKSVAFIEPMFILVMGGLVGGLMASLIMPLFDMINTIKS